MAASGLWKVWAAAGALAAAEGAQAQAGGWTPFVSVTPVYQGQADLDGGGEVSAWSAFVRVGVLGSLGGGQRGGLTLNLDHTDYKFSDLAAFGGVAPWTSVRRYGAAAPLSFAWNDGWSLGITPSADWIGEKGAASGESLTWGAIVSATRQFADGNRLGFGLGVFDRLEQTSFFPLVLVDWRLSDRWRLLNPLPAGPTGPAGLELDLRLDSGWNVGLGAARRTTRFRLSETGPVANGIGEERGLPVFLRASRRLGAAAQVNLYAGIVAGGELRVEDPSGKTLRQVDAGTAPLVGATFSARF
jgi:hypothetical protein